MTIKISPRFMDAKLPVGCGVDPKIDVFEDWMTGWVLNHAQALCAGNYVFGKDAGFAILTLVTVYFEPIESYHTGQSSDRQSKAFFRRGFLRVFPQLGATLQSSGYAEADRLADEIANEIYDQLRCGLFHEGGTKNKLIIGPSPGAAPLGLMLETTTGHVGSIFIDPCKFLVAVQNHLQDYVAKLCDPLQVDLRRKFETFFDTRISRANETILPPIIKP